MADTKSTVAINIRNVPVELARKAKARAALEGKTLQAAMIELIAQYAGVAAIGHRKE